jgi:hypothetical protein
VCCIHVIEGTCQNPRGGFGFCRPPPPKRPISLIGFDVKLLLQIATGDVASERESGRRARDLLPLREPTANDLGELALLEGEPVAQPCLETTMSGTDRSCLPPHAGVS